MLCIHDYVFHDFVDKYCILIFFDTDNACVRIFDN